MNLGTEEAVHEWREHHLSEKADDGEPRFVKEMIDQSKRRGKWNKFQGTFSHLDTQCTICHITRVASVLFLTHLFESSGC